MSNKNGIHHVVNDDFKPGEKSFCGRVMWPYDMPIKLDHAIACIEQGTYLQPCKKCIEHYVFMGKG